MLDPHHQPIYTFSKFHVIQLLFLVLFFKWFIGPSISILMYSTLNNLDMWEQQIPSFAGDNIQ